MYWSAHVGTQENGWHDVMKNGTQSSNKESLIPIAPAIGKLIYSLQAQIWNGWPHQVIGHSTAWIRFFEIEILKTFFIDEYKK